MRKARNIAILLLVYAGAVGAAWLLLRGDLASLATELSRAMWAVAALIVTTASHLAWKAHEAQEAKGLDMDQLLRVRQVARWIGVRAYLISAAALITAVVGMAASTPTLSALAPGLASVAIGIMAASLAVALVWLPTLHADLQRFRSLVHEQQVRREAAAALGERIKKGLGG